jgi:hypothetical protein
MPRAVAWTSWPIPNTTITFDGSSGTNSGGSAAAARSRYEAGVATANSHNLANPGFLALYGMEWGTIDGNGHLNIFNSTELYAWEYNASNELFGHVYVAKGDYAGLYTTMRSKGAIGQFNHPSTSNQFKVNNVSLGYTADGDEVMVLSEVMNTSAFSSNTTETETARSTYEGAFRILLERGFHVAPATNQDNHCANWGASYTNRTAVLIPTGTPLTKDSFLEALRARRVFATMDKHSQLVFSANDQIMGSRINNSGALNLNVGFHNPNGRSVAGVEIWAGVPGRNGTMTVLSTSATHSFTPAAGQHVFYAKLTQDDGKIIWSAPIWVTQGEGGGGGGDSTPPTVTASVSGNSGTLTLSASASDNVGVSKVEFWIDGSLVGSLTNGPFTLSYDSRQLANGSHSLTAKAFDAAGNSATSSQRDARELALAHLHHVGARRASFRALSLTHRCRRCARRPVDHAQAFAGGRHQAGLLEQRADGQRRAAQRHLGNVVGHAAGGPALEVVVRRVGRRGAVEARGDLLGQQHLGVLRVAPAGDLGLQPGDLGSGRKQQLEPAPHQHVADRQHLGEHGVGRLGDADVVALALGHLLDAVQAFEQRHGQDALRLLAVFLLQRRPTSRLNFWSVPPSSRSLFSATES